MSATLKPWYKSPLKLAGAILGGLILASILFLIGQTVYFMVLIKMGKMQPLADTRFEQLRISVSKALDKRLSDKELARIEEGTNPTLGNPDAKLHIVEFVDYECPNTKKVAPVIAEYMARHAEDAYLIIRDYPITELYPYAQASALAARCVFDVDPAKYWSFQERLFATQGSERSLEGYVQEVKALGVDTNKFAECYRTGKYLSEINSSVLLGEGLRISGTPAFYFNGTVFEGAMDKDFLEVVADEARKKADAK
ncbi:thioredoxin domain-containing protein [Candidatus Uhrbacteria bacterium]|nr:thioredoxin domain-containing protein [Candidatus Uhrbacteria bacterium]